MEKREMGETNLDSKFRGEEEEEAEAEVEIWNYVFAFIKMAVVKCAIELGIADTIESHGGPMTLPELSSTLGCDPSRLYRIMRFLVHYNIFKEKPTSKGAAGYAQTPLSLRLLRRGAKSFADLIVMESSPVMLAPWHCLSAHVLGRGTGNSAFEVAHGKEIWKFAAENPDHSKLMNSALASHARIVIPKIVKHCPEVFDGLKTLVDVGGGYGTYTAMLVKACPWIQGINFDLPRVVSEAPECAGVEHVGGDMFESIPKADAALLKWVLHDWNDEACIKILKKCKEAIPCDKGKVIIIEAIVGEEKDDKFEFARLTMDIEMLGHTDTGKERTHKEWEFILQESGFGHHTIKRFGGVPSVIEAFP